jgi:hypothetical protein
MAQGLHTWAEQGGLEILLLQDQLQEMRNEQTELKEYGHTTEVSSGTLCSFCFSTIVLKYLEYYSMSKMVRD